MTKKIAEEIIHLLKDMSSGNVSSEWADITKSAVAEAILNLTRIEEAHRDPSECLKDPVLWLSLASLCVLDKDHVDSLSSGEWNGEATASRPTCDNHDDGETLAIILCDQCGNLCAGNVLLFFKLQWISKRSSFSTHKSWLVCCQLFNC